MADWTGMSRSNYVKLINVPVLEQLFPDAVVTEKEGLCCIYSDHCHGDTPAAERGDENAPFFEDNGLEDYVGLIDVIHLFLEKEPDNVFVWITAGHEKARYVTGHAIAIDHTGTILDRVSLDDIYDDTNWNRAEY